MRDRFPLSRFAELTKGYNLPAIEAEIPVMLKDLGSTPAEFLRLGNESKFLGSRAENLGRRREVSPDAEVGAACERQSAAGRAGGEQARHCGIPQRARDHQPCSAECEIRQQWKHQGCGQSTDRKARSALMAEDYIEEAQREAKLRFGRELSPTELATEFAKHKFEARVFHLKNLKCAETLGVREAASRLRHERALQIVHHRLNRVDQCATRPVRRAISDPARRLSTASPVTRW
jgi:hypothetical protein